MAGNEIPNASFGPVCQLSSLVFLNGSTDYIEIYAYQGSGGNLNVGANSSYYKFQAAMIRSA